MDKKIIDDIVWHIPFKKLRNSVRTLLMGLNNNFDNVESIKRLLIENNSNVESIKRLLIENNAQNMENIILLIKKMNDISSFQEIDSDINLENYSYNIFSSNGEDGIINEIFKRIGVTNKIYVDIGKHDKLKNNTYLLLYEGWQGILFESDKTNFDIIKKYFELPIMEGDLLLQNINITIHNIDKVLYKYVYNNNIDLLSLNIEVDNYNILKKSIYILNPRVIAVKYNDNFLYKYNEIENSLEFISNLLNSKGYVLVTVSLVGEIAFFIKKELCTDKLPEYKYDLKNNYVSSNLYREKLYNSYKKDNFTNILSSNNVINILLSVANDILGLENIKIIFEFGSRYGEDASLFARKLPNAKIYSFECNKDTISECKNRCSRFSNIILTEKAISESNGTVTFYPIDTSKTNIPHHIDGNAGASSLLKTSPNYKDEIYEQYEIQVESTRLDTFMSDNNINSIDILWMDIQGAELSALKSLSNRIKDVKIIHTETEFIEEYENQPLFMDIKKYLYDNDFIYIGLTSQWKNHHGNSVFVNKKYYKKLQFDILIDPDKNSNL